MAGFLEDSKGNKSSIRLLLFIIVGYALVIGTFVVFIEGSVAGLAFISGIIALGGTFKIIQNSQEKKDGQESA